MPERVVVVSECGSSFSGEQKPVNQKETEEQQWQRYAAELVGLHMSAVGAKQAIDEARRAGLTFARAQELLALYHRLRASDRRVNAGWLNRWLRGLSQPPELQSAPAKQLGQRGDAMPRDQVRSIVGSGAIIRDGRRRGLSDAEIEIELRAAGFAGWPS